MVARAVHAWFGSDYREWQHAMAVCPILSLKLIHRGSLLVPLPQGIAHLFLCPEMNINEWPWESDNMCRGAAAKPMWSRGER